MSLARVLHRQGLIILSSSTRHRPILPPNSHNIRYRVTTWSRENINVVQRKYLSTSNTHLKAAEDSHLVTPEEYQQKKIYAEAVEHIKRKAKGESKRYDPKEDSTSFWPGGDIDVDHAFPNIATGKNQPSSTVSSFLPKATQTKMSTSNRVYATEPSPATASRGSESPMGTRQPKPTLKERLAPEWAKSPVAAQDMSIGRKATKASVDSFEALGISKSTADVLASKWTITRPTEIQAITIPEFIKGDNLLVAAQTGTGKTLSYVLPLLERLHVMSQQKHYRRRGQRTRSLVVVPNRELGLQVQEVIKTLLENDSQGRFTDFKTYLMAGGLDPVKKEFQFLNPGLDVLITTPDRLVAHLKAEHMHLDDLSIVVFDEADTLLTRPIITEDTSTVIQLLKKQIRSKTIQRPVQHAFVSATVSKPLLDVLKREYPAIVTAVSDNIHRSVETLKQEFLFGAAGDFKKRLLFSTLKKYKGERTIVFCNTVEICKSVCTHLEKTGYSVLVLHSEMHPKKRRASFEAFNAGEGRILVATDVASRGLDLGNKVEHVVLYDFPTNVLDYLHRVGRTARAGKPGHATAFIGRSDHRLATTIRTALQDGQSLADISPTLPDIKRRRPTKQDIAPEYQDEYEEEKRSRHQKKSRSKKSSEQVLEFDEDMDDLEGNNDDDFGEEPKFSSLATRAKTVSKPKLTTKAVKRSTRLVSKTAPKKKISSKTKSPKVLKKTRSNM